MGVYSLLILGCAVVMSLRRESLSIYMSSIAAIIVATVVMIAISVQKTDGAWGWNAGAKQIAGKND